VRQIHVWRGKIDAVQDLIPVPDHVGAEHAHLARARLQKAEHHGDRRRLARAVAAEQSDRLAGRHLKADMVDGQQ
jgi:hypothetical protein